VWKKRTAIIQQIIFVLTYSWNTKHIDWRKKKYPQKGLFKAQQETKQDLGITLSDDDLIFCHIDGSPLLPDTISHIWIKLAKRCGLDGIRLHDCRYTHASIMLKQGAYPKIVRERLGHASIHMTLDTYSHVAPGLQQATTESFDKLLKRDNQNEISSKLVANL
jgi:integrase